MLPINYDAFKTVASTKTQTTDNQYLSNPITAPKTTRHNIAKILGLILLGLVLIIILPLLLKIVIVVFGFVGLCVYAASYYKNHTKAVQQFLADNNWQFISPPAITVPSLSQPGDRAVVRSQAISGTLGNTTFTLYTYASGGGKYERDSEVLTLQLPNTFPTITLDALANNILGSNLLNHPNNRGLVEISLEGNFQQSFKVYMEPNQQVDVLTIITPELMQNIIDTGAFFDIDIIGNSVHIISNIGLIKYPYIEKMLTFGQSLATSLESKLRTYAAPALSDSTQYQPETQSYTAPN